MTCEIPKAQLDHLLEQVSGSNLFKQRVLMEIGFENRPGDSYKLSIIDPNETMRVYCDDFELRRHYNEPEEEARVLLPLHGSVRDIGFVRRFYRDITGQNLDERIGHNIEAEIARLLLNAGIYFARGPVGITTTIL